MTATLSMFTYSEITVDGVVIPFGSRNVPVEVTVAGEKYDASKAIANTSGDNFNSDVLWENGDGGFEGPIDLLAFESDQDVLLQLRSDNATDTYVVLEVKANQPLLLRSGEILANDDATAPIGADGSATTLDTVDQISVKNNNDASAADVTANVRLLLIT